MKFGPIERKQIRNEYISLGVWIFIWSCVAGFAVPNIAIFGDNNPFANWAKDQFVASTIFITTLVNWSVLGFIFFLSKITKKVEGIAFRVLGETVSATYSVAGLCVVVISLLIVYKLFNESFDLNWLGALIILPVALAMPIAMTFIRHEMGAMDRDRKEEKGL